MTTVEIMADKVEAVPLSKLKTFPGNPRRGNVDLIAESLRRHGQFRPLVVQKSTKFVLGGNHTYMAAQKNGWKTIKVVTVDVDDEEAKRIVLMDNKASDDATMESRALAEMLASLPDADGTGYSDRERNALIAIVESATDEAVGEMMDTNLDSIVGEALGEDDPLSVLPDYLDDEEDEEQPFLDAPDELKGPYQLTDEIDIPYHTRWDIPPLRSDMMIEDLPDNLQSWAGSATRDETDDTIWWLYNFGVDSTSGMRNVSQMILSFYSWDEYFEPWWDKTPKYMSRALNSGIKMAVCPNFSQGGISRAEALYNFFRSRYLGRYFQEVGIRVMPDLEMVHDKVFYDCNTQCLPKRVPWASVQVQNITGSSRGGNRASDEDVENWKTEMLATFHSTHPENLLVYGNEKGFQMIEDLKLPVDEIRFIISRVSKLAERAKGREKKTTL